MRIKRRAPPPGPRRWSARLQESMTEVRSVPSSSQQPIDLSVKSDSPPPSPPHPPTVSPTPDINPPKEPEKTPIDTNMDVNMGDENLETKDPGVGPSEQPYSNPKFATPQAEDRYLNWYSKRAVLCERGINLEDYASPPYELVDMINSRGWYDWVIVSQKAVIPLVREFYSNAVKGKKGVMEMRTNVRKKEIYLTPASIAMYTGLPFGQTFNFTSEQQSLWEDQLKKENLVKLISGNPQAEWKGARLSKGDLSDKSKVLHMLVCSKILPHAYVSTVTLPQAEMIGRLLLDIPMDLTQCIWNTIIGAIERPEVNSGLPFGGLITKILQGHEVKGKSGMEIATPASRIAKTSMKRSRGQLARKAAAEPREEQQAEGQSGNEEVTLQSLYALMKEVKDNQMELFVELKNLKDKQAADHRQTIEKLEELSASAVHEGYATPLDH